MESFLQSIVKIIIIGSLYESKYVYGNRQFLPPPSPPLPYYQNGEYLPPGFVVPYQESIPVYYQDENLPPPISYQNINSYSPPQLFHQNVNYDPLLAANPSGTFPPPHILPYKPSFYPLYKPQQRINSGVSHVNHKKAQPGSPTEISPKKPAFYATNIVVKEESQPPYYHDDYSKNYHDEDYNDNYSDDISSPPEPCLNSPYRYFEPTKTNPNNKYSLCSPYFQPNFGNGIYTVKMPITLLPSRFPPRVEELIERIQNYFSTYTQQETPKPQNQTVTTTTTTVQPVTEATSESETHSTVMMEAHNKKNTTVEIEELNLELPETTVEAVNGLEQTTQKTIVVEIEKIETQKEITSTLAPDAQSKKESQMAVQGTPSPKQETQNPTTANLFASHQQESQIPLTVSPLQESLSMQNQIVKEWGVGPGIQPGNLETENINVDSMRAATGATEKRNSLEDTSSVQPVIHVTDNTS